MDPLADLVAVLWNEHAREETRATPPEPRVVLMVGVPLSGKSTVAKHLATTSPWRCLHVENDPLRARIAERLGQPMPSYEGPENRRTYALAWDLIDLALQAGIHVVHDGTNLTERGRRGAYEVAERHGVPVGVVFVVTPREVLEARALAVDASRREGYLKLGRRQPEPDACTRPHVVVDGSRPVADTLERLAEADVVSALLRADRT